MTEAAEYLNVPKRTLAARWRPWGLRAHKVGRALRFRERELERWLDAPERAA
jgi:excisionase family DNA binding protein